MRTKKSLIIPSMKHQNSIQSVAISILLNFKGIINCKNQANKKFMRHK